MKRDKMKKAVLKNVENCLEFLDDPEFKHLITEFDNKTIEVTINAMHVMIINLARLVVANFKTAETARETISFVISIESLLNQLGDQIRELETKDKNGE